MSFMAKFKDLVGIDDDYEDDYETDRRERELEQEREAEARRRATIVQSQTRKYGLTDEPVTVKKERENVIAMPKSSSLKELTARFNIVAIDPKSFNDCPDLVDSLKARKPVIINLEKIETDTARKIFDFLSGAAYALNGNVHKIANNIFVFLPENVDVSTNAEHSGIKFADETANPWK